MDDFPRWLDELTITPTQKKSFGFIRECVTVDTGDTRTDFDEATVQMFCEHDGVVLKTWYVGVPGPAVTIRLSHVDIEYLSALSKDVRRG